MHRVGNDAVADTYGSCRPLGIAAHRAHDTGRLVSQMHWQLRRILTVGAAVHLVVDRVVPAALTSINTCPGFGSPRDSSITERTSGPPNPVATTALVMLL